MAAVNPFASEVAALQLELTALQSSLAAWARRRDDFLAYQAGWAQGTSEYQSAASTIQECREAIDRITGEVRVKQDQLNVATEQRDRVDSIAGGMVAGGVDTATAYANAASQVAAQDQTKRIVKYTCIGLGIVLVIIGIVWYIKKRKQPK